LWEATKNAQISHGKLQQPTLSGAGKSPETQANFAVSVKSC
jgi:hypothetical protein